MTRLATLALAGTLMTGPASAGQIANEAHARARSEACQSYADEVLDLIHLIDPQLKDADDLIAVAAEFTDIAPAAAAVMMALPADKKTALAGNVMTFTRAHSRFPYLKVLRDCQAGTLDFIDNLMPSN